MVAAIFKIAFVVAVFQCYAKAETLEDLKKRYLEVIMECAKEFPIQPMDVEKLKIKQVPDSDNAKCLLACAYRGTGMMDESGTLSVQGVNEITQKYFANNPELMLKSTQFTEACKSVNDVAVADGDKGCERAALIYKCSVEKANQFDFDI